MGALDQRSILRSRPSSQPFCRSFRLAEREGAHARHFLAARGLRVREEGVRRLVKRVSVNGCSKCTTALPFKIFCIYDVNLL